MEEKDFDAGSRNPQEGDIVPDPPRSGEPLVPESCDGQTTSQVSTAGIRVDLVIVKEVLLCNGRPLLR